MLNIHYQTPTVNPWSFEAADVSHILKVGAEVFVSKCKSLWSLMTGMIFWKRVKLLSSDSHAVPNMKQKSVGLYILFLKGSKLCIDTTFASAKINTLS